MKKIHIVLISVLSALCLLLLISAVWLFFATRELTEERSAAPTPAATQNGEPMGDVVINEFMEKNKAVLQDEDGDFSDWVELYNPSAVAVSLKGWRLADSEEDSGWVFPDVTLEDGKYLTVFLSGKDRRGAELHTDFSLSGEEGLYLTDESGTLRSSALCCGCDKDVAMALDPSGEYVQSEYPTPGFENSVSGYESYQAGLSAAGPLVINEAVVSGFSVLYPSGPADEDWVEIKNISTESVALSDYYLSDDDDNYLLWQLPDIALAPGEMLLVVCDGQAKEMARGIAFSGFSLDSENEQLYLADSGGTLVDYMSLRGIPYCGSFGRTAELTGYYYFPASSPLSNNTGGALRVSEKPVCLSDDGVYDDVDGVTVELSAKGGIYYTLDGSVPTKESAMYEGPITLSATSVLRAISIESGALASPALTLSYIINEGHSLPVVTLSTDSPYEYSKMYKNSDKEKELPANLAYYGPDGSFSIGCGVSMNGASSLSMEKKNLSLRFRGAYGASTLDYDLYGGGVTQFTNLLLRSGQDFPAAIVRNELCQELCAITGDNVINQRSRFVVLYVNGEYSGIYTLKEKANEQLYASIAGVSKDSVALEEVPLFEGDAFYQDVIHFCVLNDMRLPENYEHLCQIVDMDSLIDYLIMEGFCANTDVGNGNMRFVRSSENDGKWRFMFYDLDSTFMLKASVFNNLMSEHAAKTIQFSSFVVPLMKNDKFKAAFLSRAGELFRDTLTNEAVLSTLDALAEEIAPEVPRDYARFGMSLEDWESDLDFIRNLVEQLDWRQYNIDALSTLFGLTAAQRQQYFGDIDTK